MGLENLPDISEAVRNKEVDFLKKYGAGGLLFQTGKELASGIKWLRDNKPGLSNYLDVWIYVFQEGLGITDYGKRVLAIGYFKMLMVRLLEVIGDALSTERQSTTGLENLPDVSIELSMHEGILKESLGKKMRHAVFFLLQYGRAGEELAACLKWLRDNRPGLSNYLDILTFAFEQGLTMPEEKRVEYFGYLQLTMVKLLQAVGDALATEGDELE